MPTKAKPLAPCKAEEQVTTMDEQIVFLQSLQERLARWLDELTETDEMLKVFSLLSQNVSRLARLIQARALIQKPNADWLDRALEVVNEDIQLALAERGKHTYA